jgi:hypothetical protein
MSPQRLEAEVVRLLARYFHDNPLACDTAEGAMRWWLPQKDDISEGMVTTALDSLVAQGALETLPAVDGRVRYRRIPKEAARTVLARIAKTPVPRDIKGMS